MVDKLDCTRLPQHCVSLHQVSDEVPSLDEPLDLPALVVLDYRLHPCTDQPKTIGVWRNAATRCWHKVSNEHTPDTVTALIELDAVRYWRP